MNNSISFSLPSTPDSYNEMEVDHNEQMFPSTEASIILPSIDHMDLENEAQIIAPRMPFGDITNALNSSARGLATVPLHAGAILIISKTVNGTDKTDAKIGEINKDCENLLHETVKKAAITLHDGSEMNLVSKQPLPNDWNSMDPKGPTNLLVQSVTIYMTSMYPSFQYLRASKENLNDGAAKVLFEPQSTNDRDARVRANINVEVKKLEKRVDQFKAKRHRSRAPINYKTVSNNFQYVPGSPLQDEILRKAFHMIGITEPRADQLITSQVLIFNSTKKYYAHFVPTGAGKSAIYQVAALILRKVIFAVFPLVGLSEDQYKTIKELDRFGAYIPHQMSKSELKDFQNRLDTMTTWSRMSRPILVVVTESSLASLKSQISHLSKHDLISLLVLDEIHLIVEDGQRFRPKLYQNTKSAVSTIHRSNTKVVCFTASPGKQMYEDLEVLLEHKLDYTLWGSPMNRNSSIRFVTECKDTLKTTTDQLLEDHVRDHVDKKAIIFTDFATQAEGKVSDWAKEVLARLKDEEGIERGEVMTFVGDDGDMKKWYTMNRFSKPLELDSTNRGCYILVGTKAIEAGISSKDLIFGLCVAPPRSLKELIQKMGRLARTSRPYGAMVFDEFVIIYTVHSISLVVSHIYSASREQLQDPRFTPTEIKQISKKIQDLIDLQIKEIMEVLKLFFGSNNRECLHLRLETFFKCPSEFTNLDSFVVEPISPTVVADCKYSCSCCTGERKDKSPIIRKDKVIEQLETANYLLAAETSSAPRTLDQLCTFWNNVEIRKTLFVKKPSSPPLSGRDTNYLILQLLAHGIIQFRKLSNLDNTTLEVGWTLGKNPSWPMSKVNCWMAS
jgi:hypothetical protein